MFGRGADFGTDVVHAEGAAYERIVTLADPHLNELPGARGLSEGGVLCLEEPPPFAQMLAPDSAAPPAACGARPIPEPDS